MTTRAFIELMDDRPPYPEHASASWPAEGSSAGEPQWRTAVDTFKELLAQVDELARSGSAALAREVDATHPSHTERAASASDVLWQLLVHNSYHVGQIAMLRRMLGLWPPRAGGDTW